MSEFSKPNVGGNEGEMHVGLGDASPNMAPISKGFSGDSPVAIQATEQADQNQAARTQRHAEFADQFEAMRKAIQPAPVQATGFESSHTAISVGLMQSGISSPPSDKHVITTPTPTIQLGGGGEGNMQSGMGSAPLPPIPAQAPQLSAVMGGGEGPMVSGIESTKFIPVEVPKVPHQNMGGGEGLLTGSMSNAGFASIPTSFAEQDAVGRIYHAPQVDAPKPIENAVASTGFAGASPMIAPMITPASQTEAGRPHAVHAGFSDQFGGTNTTTTPYVPPQASSGFSPSFVGGGEGPMLTSQTGQSTSAYLPPPPAQSFMGGGEGNMQSGMGNGNQMPIPVPPVASRATPNMGGGEGLMTFGSGAAPSIPMVPSQAQAAPSMGGGEGLMQGPTMGSAPFAVLQPGFADQNEVGRNAIPPATGFANQHQPQPVQPLPHAEHHCHTCELRDRLRKLAVKPGRV